MVTLSDKIKSAPEQSGCYLYKNNMGYIIYVGKAKNIRSRVRQYFRASSIRDNQKLQDLVRAIADVEFCTTDTELDALILEYHLIKQYRPWFNAQLKLDAPYPLIRIGMEEEYPPVYIVREKSAEKSEYIDCFYNESKALEAIELISAVWKTPVCGKKSFTKVSSACMQHHMEKCFAPCERRGDASAYREILQEVVRFLKGRQTSVLPRLKKEMKELSTELRFEEAAECKRKIEELAQLQNKCKKMFHFPIDRDVLLFIRPYRSPEFSLFYVKKGSVVNRGDFSGKLDEDALFSFLQRMGSKEGIRPITGIADPLAGAIVAADFFQSEVDIAKCLIEITANKLFVPLPLKSSRAIIEKKIRTSSALFGNGD